MRIIGVTGGIGAGKSTVLNILKDSFDAGIIVADELGHLAMEKDSPTYQEMVEAFGDGILDEDKEIDRGVLAGILFSSDELLEKQNSIVHPFVKKKRDELIEIYEAEGKNLIIIESAILFEAGIDAECDEIWYVSADKDVRIDRLMRDRGYSRAKSEMIMAKQHDEEEYKSRCSLVIYNNGSIDEVYKQIEERLT